MPMRSLAAVAALLLVLHAPSVPVQGQGTRPKLVVFIVVDQMRGDYPERYAGLLEHGLKRLTTRREA